MNEESFNFSVQLGGDRNADPTRLIARPFDSWQAASGERLLLCAGEIEPLRVPDATARILLPCDQFRTLEEHVQTVIGHWPGMANSRTAITRALDSMRSSGVLVDEGSVFADLAGPVPDSASAQDSPQAPAVLYVRTCGRPAALARLLDSLVELRDRAQPLERLVVLDDSRNPGQERANAALIAEYRSRTAVELVHIGSGGRRDFVRATARRAGVEPDHLEWFLDGGDAESEGSYGCGYNLALLLSAGRPLALIDDDAQLRPHVRNSADGGLVLAPTANRRAWYSDDPGNPEAGWEAAQFNPVAEHGRWLGRSLAGLVVPEQGRKSELLAGLDSASLIEFRPAGRVRITVNGSIGDPGTREMLWQFQRPAFELQGWLAGEDRYRDLVTGRRLVRCVDQPLAYVENSLMTTTLCGIDNRQLLLPTIPRGRNEDRVFGELVRFLYPDNLFVDQAWCLRHQPETARRWERDELSRPRRPSAGSLMAGMIRGWSEGRPAGDAARACDRLVAEFATLAETPLDAVQSDLARHLFEDRSALAQAVSATLAELDPPDYVRADFERVIEANRARHGDDAAYLEQVARQIKHRAGHYSAGLQSWVQAWEKCARTDPCELLGDAGWRSDD